MANKKFTKRAVLTSIIAVLLCCALLVGGTFAWFTDTATTGINTIESGNLDIELYYATQEDLVDGEVPADKWKNVNADESIFKNSLWEPGYTEVVYFKVENKGNLHLKYRMGVEIFNEKSSTNKYGAEFKLSDYIYAYRTDSPSFMAIDSRELAQDPFAGWPFKPYEVGTPLSQAVEGLFNGEDENASGGSLNAAAWLAPGDVYYTALVLWMPEEVGNEANYLTGKDAPQIQLGIYAAATQYTVEEDSFGPDYDEDAEYPDHAYAGVVRTPEEFEAALLEGGAITLGNDIYLTSDHTNVPKDVVINLNGNKLTAERNYPADGKPSEYISVLKVDGVNLVINGPGAVENTGATGGYAIAVDNDGSVVINGGTYGAYYDAFYVKYGTLTVNDGFVDAYADENPYAENDYSQISKDYADCHPSEVINCQDDYYVEDAAKVILKGGTYVNTDPSNVHEGRLHNQSFVAEGYKVVSQPQANGDVYYTVVAE